MQVWHRLNMLFAFLSKGQVCPPYKRTGLKTGLKTLILSFRDQSYSTHFTPFPLSFFLCPNDFSISSSATSDQFFFLIQSSISTLHHVWYGVHFLSFSAIVFTFNPFLSQHPLLSKYLYCNFSKKIDVHFSWT